LIVVYFCLDLLSKS